VVPPVDELDWSDLFGQGTTSLDLKNWLSVSSNLDAGYRKTQFFAPHYDTGLFQWDNRIELRLAPSVQRLRLVCQVEAASFGENRLKFGGKRKRSVPIVFRGGRRIPGLEYSCFRGRTN
jgi:hypothetical protein